MQTLADFTPRTLTVDELAALPLSVDGAPTLLVGFTYGGGTDIGLITVNTFHGKKSLDFRRFYFSVEKNAYVPTAKGVRLPIWLAPDVLRALSECAPEVEEHAAEVRTARRANRRQQRPR